MLLWVWWLTWVLDWACTLDMVVHGVQVWQIPIGWWKSFLQVLSFKFTLQWKQIAVFTSCLFRLYDNIIILKKTIYYFKNRLNLQHFSLTVSDLPSTRSVLSHLKCAKIILWLELIPWALLGELLLLPHALRPSKQLRRYLNPIVNSFGGTPLNSTPANNPGYATGYTIVAVCAFGSLWRWSIALVLSCIVPWMDIWVAVLR